MSDGLKQSKIYPFSKTQQTILGSNEELILILEICCRTNTSILNGI